MSTSMRKLTRKIKVGDISFILRLCLTKYEIELRNMQLREYLWKLTYVVREPCSILILSRMQVFTIYKSRRKWLVINFFRPQRVEVLTYSQVPNKRAYSISIFVFFPTLLALFHPARLANFPPYSFIRHCFSRIPIIKAYSKYPPYLFIWPYLLNWHLRV